MKLTKLMCATAVAAVAAFGATATWADKNWTPPKEKMYVQTLTDEVMKKHPDVASITFHGVPPGAAPKTYTMFGGSYLDRIGNVDDPDDVMITETGITIIDPRWHRTKDAFKKIVYMAPLRDGAGENVGEIVIAFKNDKPLTDVEVLKKGNAIRDELAKKAAKYEDYYKPAK